MLEIILHLSALVLTFDGICNTGAHHMRIVNVANAGNV